MRFKQSIISILAFACPMLSTYGLSPSARQVIDCHSRLNSRHQKILPTSPAFAFQEYPFKFDGTPLLNDSQRRDDSIQFERYTIHEGHDWIQSAMQSRPRFTIASLSAVDSPTDEHSNIRLVMTRGRTTLETIGFIVVGVISDCINQHAPYFPDL